VNRAVFIISQKKKKRAFEKEKNGEKTLAPGKKAKTKLKGKKKKHCKLYYENYSSADC
jgi:hypothetical protein